MKVSEKKKPWDQNLKAMAQRPPTKPSSTADSLKRLEEKATGSPQKRPSTSNRLAELDAAMKAAARDADRKRGEKAGNSVASKGQRSVLHDKVLREAKKKVEPTVDGDPLVERFNKDHSPSPTETSSTRGGVSRNAVANLHGKAAPKSTLKKQVESPSPTRTFTGRQASFLSPQELRAKADEAAARKLASQDSRVTGGASHDGEAQTMTLGKTLKETYTSPSKSPDPSQSGPHRLKPSLSQLSYNEARSIALRTEINKKSFSPLSSTEAREQAMLQSWESPPPVNESSPTKASPSPLVNRLQAFETSQKQRQASTLPAKSVESHESMQEKASNAAKRREEAELAKEKAKNMQLVASARAELDDNKTNTPKGSFSSLAQLNTPSTSLKSPAIEGDGKKGMNRLELFEMAAANERESKRREAPNKQSLKNQMEAFQKQQKLVAREVPP